jgi:hypothetical protein
VSIRQLATPAFRTMFHSESRRRAVFSFNKPYQTRGNDPMIVSNVMKERDLALPLCLDLGIVGLVKSTVGFLCQNNLISDIPLSLSSTYFANNTFILIKELEADEYSRLHWEKVI